MQLFNRPSPVERFGVANRHIRCRACSGYFEMCITMSATRGNANKSEKGVMLPPLDSLAHFHVNMDSSYPRELLQFYLGKNR